MSYFYFVNVLRVMEDSVKMADLNCVPHWAIKF